MADEKKVIEIQADYSTAVKGLLESKQAVADLRAQNALLNESFKYGKITQQTYASQLEVNNAKIKNLSKIVNDNQKALQEEVAQVKGSEGAYQKLNLQYQIAAQKAKDMAAQYGVSSTASKSASAEASILNEKLKLIDKSAGQNQRSVGDYGLATAKLPGIFGEMQASGQAVLVSLRTKFESVKDATMDFSAALAAQKAAQIEASAAQMAALEAESIAAASATAAEEARSLANTTAATTGETSAIAAAQLSAAEEAEAVASATAATAEEARAVATTASTTATEAGSAAMRIFKIALASTGIGLLVVALSAVVAYFTSTNEGAKMFSRVMSGVNAVIQEGVKFMGNLGKLIVDVLTGNIKSLGSDIDNIKNGVKNAGTEIEQSYKRGNAIKAERQKLDKNEREWMVERTKLEGEYSVALLASRNKGLSNEDRLKSAQKAKQINEELYKNDLSLAQRNAKLVEAEQSLNSKKDFKAIADAKNRTAQVVAAHNQAAQQVENKTGIVAAKIQTAAEKAAAAAARLEEKEIATTAKILESKGKIIDATEKNSLIDEDVYNKSIQDSKDLATEQLALLDRKSKLEKMTADKVDMEKQVILENERKRIAKFTIDRTDMLISAMNVELSIEDEKNKQLRAGRNSTFEEQKSNLDRRLQLDIESNDLKLESDKNYIDQSELIYQKYKTSQIDIDTQIANQAKQNKANQLSDELEAYQDNIDETARIKHKQLIDQQREELKVQNLTESQKEAINKKYKKLNTKIDQEAFNAKLDMAGNVTSGLATLLGKETTAGKLANAANVTIEGAKSAFKTGAAAAEYFAKGNVPMGILAGVETGIIVANTAKSVADIYAVNTDVTSAAESASGSTSTVTSKFHTGGIAGQDALSDSKSDELTSILLKGERVLSLQQTDVFNSILGNLSDMGGSSQITNNIGNSAVNSMDLMESAFSRVMEKQKPPQLIYKEFAKFVERQQTLANNLVVK